jgi:glutathione S-transferase
MLVSGWPGFLVLLDSKVSTATFHRVAKVPDGQLLGRKFVTGDCLTLAEMAHYPIEPYGEIRRWYAGLCTSQAWQKPLAQTALPTATAA